jgi:hypothetical protein
VVAHGGRIIFPSTHNNLFGIAFLRHPPQLEMNALRL